MNKIIKVTLLLVFISFCDVAYTQELTKAKIDLINVQDDKVYVTMSLDDQTTDSIEFHIPKIVPGTYSISDFGRFVSDFTAFDTNGDTLKSEQVSINRWIIRNASQLDYVGYWIDDTFDKNKSYKDNIIFEPGGTSLEKENEVYVLNTFGFIGYFKGYEMNPFEVKISKKPGLYGSTALEAKSMADSMDIFVASNYNFLADGPILYCEPDTVTKNIAGAEILVSVYSPNDVLTATEIMDNIDELMEAQADYLGGTLPVDRYAYLIYLTDESSLSGAMGALEHSYSSLYFLPEANADQISQTVKDVAAHEFLHIVTPLNIHSEEIHYFDYINPDMSEHLWLYEGVTEYSSMHVQVRNNLYDFETFLSEIRKKIYISQNYPLVSFTEMSANILTPEYEEMYQNVYYKGALIGMCLDLSLIKYSNGSMDLPALMRSLADIYGPNEPFKDGELIDKIEEITYPEIGDFLRTHVKGDSALPLQKTLEWAGVLYAPEYETEYITLGSIGLTYNREMDKVEIRDISEMDKFGQDMGYLEGDLISSINGDELTVQNISEIIGNFSANVEPGDKVTVEVLREKKGEYKKKKLKAKALKTRKAVKHYVGIIDDLSDEQQKIRDAWINGLENQ